MSTEEQIKKYKSYLPKDLTKDEVQDSVNFVLNRSKWLQPTDIIIQDNLQGETFEVMNIIDGEIHVMYTNKQQMKIIKDGELPFYYKLSNVAGEYNKEENKFI